MENRGVRRGGETEERWSDEEQKLSDWIRLQSPQSEQVLEITSQQVNIWVFSPKRLFLQAENDKSMSYRVFHTIQETLSSCFAFQVTGHYTLTESLWRGAAASSLSRGEVSDREPVVSSYYLLVLADASCLNVIKTWMLNVWENHLTSFPGQVQCSWLHHLLILWSDSSAAKRSSAFAISSPILPVI